MPKSAQSKAQGSVLGQVNSADRFKLTAQVDEFYLGHVAVGQETLFNVDGRRLSRQGGQGLSPVSNGTSRQTSISPARHPRAFISARPST